MGATAAAGSTVTLRRPGTFDIDALLTLPIPLPLPLDPIGGRYVTVPQTRKTRT
jgi:hypothetical protein